MTRIVVVGEGMLELAPAEGGWRLSHGGDTLNVAVHLARLGRNVAYATAIGTDPFSVDLRAAWTAEGMDTSAVLADPDRLPGLYAIRTDGGGERSFTYWRGESAARRLFALPDADRVVALIGAADLVILSLVSLAILPPEGRTMLLDFCAKARAQGAAVTFDGNYRSRACGDSP